MDMAWHNKEKDKAIDTIKHAQRKYSSPRYVRTSFQVIPYDFSTGAAAASG